MTGEGGRGRAGVIESIRMRERETGGRECATYLTCAATVSPFDSVTRSLRSISLITFLAPSSSLHVILGRLFVDRRCRRERASIVLRHRDLMKVT